MPVSRRAMQWLLTEWPYAGQLAAFFLFALLPLWWKAFGPALTLVYLQLPVYLVHQYEEHDKDRFRCFLNAHMAGGREALTPAATFWINSLGVWGVDLISLYLACWVSLAFGLIAVYLALVNGVIHCMATLALRAYNPGLLTGIVLFLPVGGWALATVSAQSHADWRFHLLAAGIAVAIHAAILIHVRNRIASLDRLTVNE